MKNKIYKTLGELCVYRLLNAIYCFCSMYTVEGTSIKIEFLNVNGTTFRIKFQNIYKNKTKKKLTQV
uniref:Uncharacterized protein n=1 Tax=Anguilla anguilla TaxID=7936 RepID=A0A0E9RB81_ANGAN